MYRTEHSIYGVWGLVLSAGSDIHWGSRNGSPMDKGGHGSEVSPGYARDGAVQREPCLLPHCQKAWSGRFREAPGEGQHEASDLGSSFCSKPRAEMFFFPASGAALLSSTAPEDRMSILALCTSWERSWE